MKFRKKMVTLLAAVLIAMIGVMPALATTATVPLTVTVTAIISISASPTSVDFGTFVGSPQTATITISNDGNVAVTVVATVSGAAFTSHLVITPGTPSYLSIAYGSTGDADLTLTLPANYVAGVHTGSILFTAS